MEGFLFFYVLTGDNYIRPLIKYLPLIPDGTNVVVLTNTPKLLKDIKPNNFNLIVEDLDKYRSEWSIENEKVLYIEDEDEYMLEYKRLYHEEKYRYPMAIFRFAMNWAIQNNVTKFMIVDAGCKIGYPGEEQVVKTAFERIRNVFKEKNVMVSHTYTGLGSQSVDHFKNHLESDTWLTDILKKYIPNFNPETYPDHIIVSDYIWSEEEQKPIESRNKEIFIGSDGYCIGFWVRDINLIKMILDFWNDYVKKGYECMMINPNETNKVYVEFEHVFAYMASLLCKYYNFILSPHHTIVRHFYQPENDWVVNKIPHLEMDYNVSSREEFLRKNKEKLIIINGPTTANTIIDGFDNI